MVAKIKKKIKRKTLIVVNSSHRWKTKNWKLNRNWQRERERMFLLFAPLEAEINQKVVRSSHDRQHLGLFSYRSE